MARARAALGLLVLLAHPSPASAQDTTPPTLERAFVTVGGRHIVLNFFEDLQLRSNLPPASAFTVTADGSAVTVSGFLRDSIHPMALGISVSPAVRQGQTVVVTYTDPTSGDDANAIQDTAGNDAASFTTGSGGVPVVINESSVGSPTAPVQDTGPPTLDKARVFSTGLKIMFRFSGGLQESNLPPASAFTVTADGSDVPVSGFYRLPFVLTHLEMGFSLGVRRGQTVVVSYTDPTSGDDANAIQDTAGNDAASFTTGSGGVPAVINESRLSPTVITPPPPTRPPPTDGGGGGTRGPSQTVPGAPRNLLADATDGAVTLTWDAPENDDGSEITDYEYRIDRRNPWISIGSTQTTHTVTGLDNGTAYVFEVRAVNRIGKSFSSNRAEATPEAPEVFTLDFAHFAKGNGTTSDLVFVNVAPQPVRPALYFYDTEGNPIAAESVVDITGDLEIREDGGLTVLTEMEPLGELTIATHGQGDLVSGSVKVASEGLIGGMLRFDLPGIGEAVVGASPPVSDALFAVRRQEGGITTGVAIHNLGAEAVEVSCQLMSGGVVLEEVEIPLEANGQTAWLIDAAFPAADTSDFAGSVRCDAPGRRRFSAVALEMDPGTRVFITLPLFPVDRGGGGPEAALDFAHFANGDGTTSDLVFVNVSTQQSRPAPTPFHTDILPSRPAIYFYDTEGNPIAAESVVDITGDLAIQEDGGLTVQTEMEPLGVLTVSTHGQGAIDVEPANVFPPDQTIGDSFDNDANALTVESLWFEKAIAAAEETVRAVWASPEALDRLLVTRPSPAPVEEQALYVGTEELSRACHMGDGDFTVIARINGRPGKIFTRSTPGTGFVRGSKELFATEDALVYRIRRGRDLRAEGVHIADGNPHWIALTLKDGRATLFLDGRLLVSVPEFSRPDFDGHLLKLGMGERKRGEVPADSELVYPGLEEFQFHEEALPDDVLYALTGDAESGLLPEPVFQWLPGMKPPSPEGFVTAEQAGTEVLDVFLGKTFRRPPTEDERARYRALLQEGIDSGIPFDIALQLPVVAALTSPSFLFRSEQTEQTTEPYPVSSIDMASRLSYFLWAGAPDQELLSAAKEGKLADSDELLRQTDRMLADNKAGRFFDRFVLQWLRTEGLGETYRPDADRFPDVTDSLMASMRQESVMVFGDLIRENRSLLRLLDDDSTVMNQELAKHYGYPDVDGPDWRRVALRDSSRGGLLTQAVVLTISSSPRRTSPVFRGKWVLDVLLGEPPPPPPPSVPALPAAAESAGASVRELLEAHRSQAACASCHSRMDPYGFALEQYDAIGRLRPDERDTSTRLFNGDKLDGAAGLKRYLVEQKGDAFVRHLTRKMFAYALGRELTFADERPVHLTLEQLKAEGYPAKSLLHQIVLSYPFRYRKNL